MIKQKTDNNKWENVKFNNQVLFKPCALLYRLLKQSAAVTKTIFWRSQYN